ncbi:hypothetical protein IQ273_28775 [Nodosilinea sp. LEGE 07298]|nr:hypothetical protein [Nodosilinea sp. LEGE 07298]
MGVVILDGSTKGWLGNRVGGKVEGGSPIAQGNVLAAIADPEETAQLYGSIIDGGC